MSPQPQRTDAHAATWLLADEERWQLREVDLDEFAWYCRSCAEREFGDR